MIGSVSRAVALAAAMAAVAACGRDAPTAPARPVSLAGAVDSLVLYTGDTAALRLFVRDQRGRLMAGAQPLYASGRPDVASVTRAGVVVGVSPGVATIEVGYGPAHAAIPVRVSPVAPVELDFLDDSVRFDLGTTDSVEVAFRARDPRGRDGCGSLPLRLWTDPMVASVVNRTDTARGCRIVVAPVARGETWVLGTSKGLRDSVRVRVALPAYTARFSACLPRYSDFPAACTVRLLDRLGVPVPAAEVRFEASAGSLQPAVVHTDSGGYATTAWAPVQLEVSGRQWIRARIATPGGTPLSPVWSGVIEPRLITSIRFYLADRSAAGGYREIREIRAGAPSPDTARARGAPAVYVVSYDRNGSRVPATPYVFSLGAAGSSREGFPRVALPAVPGPGYAGGPWYPYGWVELNVAGADVWTIFVFDDGVNLGRLVLDTR